jgi:hypothetical protein
LIKSGGVVASWRSKESTAPPCVGEDEGANGGDEKVGRWLRWGEDVRLEAQLDVRLAGRLKEAGEPEEPEEPEEAEALPRDGLAFVLLAVVVLALLLPSVLPSVLLFPSVLSSAVSFKLKDGKASKILPLPNMLVRGDRAELRGESVQTRSPLIKLLERLRPPLPFEERGLPPPESALERGDSDMTDMAVRMGLMLAVLVAVLVAVLGL